MTSPSTDVSGAGRAARRAPDDPAEAPTLVLVGHGSRDPRSAATLDRLRARIAARRPDLDVRLCFLELSLPSFDRTMADVRGRAVVVPLLLGRAFHATVDLPGRLDAAVAANPDLDAVLAEPLGPHRLLEQSAERIAAEQLPDADAVVLVATGSSHTAANDEVVRTAQRLAGRLGRRVVAAFTTSATPSVADVVGHLRDSGSEQVGLLPWYLAPGLLLDRALAAAGPGVTAGGTLADTAETAEAVLLRYAESADATGRRLLPRVVQ